ncbi:MAG: TIGR02221 family CRISPR-associated protein [Prevotella sp.]|nr:TIGR02221 family CRISPR-associated protein [Prevotella sp.]
MARKVFISFLGTNNYVNCRYQYNDWISEPVRFVQEAMIDYICSDWTAEDRILIFCTSKESTGELGSKELNWLDEGQPKAIDAIEKTGLQTRLQELKQRKDLKAEIEQVDISAGFTEEEIWEIFNTVYSKLQAEDEIYFDVTHAFRSIPLFSVVLFNYSKFMIDTRLISIMYGAFEKLGPLYKVKEIPEDKRIAPIIDMTNIARLQEYNQAASELKEFGRVKSLQEHIKLHDEETVIQSVRDLQDSIFKLDEYITTINIKEIKKGEFITAFRNNYKNIRKRNDIPKPIKHILEELNKETEEFVSAPSFKNLEAAINWTIKHEMLMQVFPLAEEYIILRMTEEYKDMIPNEISNKDKREFMSSVLGMPKKDFDNRTWRNILAEYPDATDDISEEEMIHELRPKYDVIRRIRNSIAHGNGVFKYAQIKAGINDVLWCLEFVNPEYKNYPSTQSIIKQYHAD